MTEDTVADVSYPLKVQYCGACTMPLEFCEYSSCKEKCREWLEKNLPELAGEVSLTEGETTAEPKKHQKRGGKGTGKEKKSKDEPGKITLQLNTRSKNKKVTVVKGLTTHGLIHFFEVKLLVFSRS
uniref:Density-regulated protein n=1 Tax=Panagrolaimus sp. JU765 TaxID=591449 RepID=A0AC34RJW1_9BILA